MTRPTKGGRPRISNGSPNAGQRGTSPRLRRKQSHNATDGPSQTPTPAGIDNGPVALVSNATQRLPPVMAMPPEARSVWNLKVLRRHDPLISRIFDQAPYGVLYTFNHAHAHEPDGGKGRKYEGTWEKTGIEGTVFLVERSTPPQYGFFLLNRGGTSSVFQMLHQDDTVELGADPKFLTFRPGLWDRATTPYTEPFTRCDKASLICLWLSDESAGPRFAYFISRVKHILSRSARHADSSSPSPTPTPLSQARPLSAAYPDAGAVDLRSKPHAATLRDLESFDASSSVRDEDGTPQASERPLDKLFASLAQPPKGATCAAARQTQCSTSAANSITQVDEIQTPAVPINPMLTSKPSAQVNSLSLLNQIFASVAGGANTTQLANGPLALEGDSGRSGSPSEGKTPPTTSSLIAPNSAAFQSSDSGHASADDDHDERDLTDESLSPYWVGGGTEPGGSHMSTRGNKGWGKTEGDEYQEPEAPSPSLIPNSLHTSMSSPAAHPDPATSSRYTADRAGGGVPIGHLDNFTSFDLPDSMQHSNGPSATRRHGIPNPEASLDVNAAAVALLDSLRTRRSNEAEGARRAHISKHDFVRGLLTLIHEQPGFVDDLYARYETLTRWDQIS